MDESRNKHNNRMKCQGYNKSLVIERKNRWITERSRK